LFKKTSADFDEGGATGLLMNHLGIDGTGRVVFDAGDAIVEDYEDEEEMEDVQIDISRLRELIPSTEDTASMVISETLQAFHFSTDSDLPDLAAITGLSSFNDDIEPEVAVPTGGEAHDFFGDEDYDIGGGGAGAFDDNMSLVGDEGDFDAGLTAASGAEGGPQAFGYGPFDPRRAQGHGFALDFGGTDDPENMFQYFDAGFGKAWAGAEHWKLRKISRRGKQQMPKWADGQNRPWRQRGRRRRQRSRSRSTLIPRHRRPRTSSPREPRRVHSFRKLSGRAPRPPPLRVARSTSCLRTCTLAVDSCSVCSSSPSLP